MIPPQSIPHLLQPATTGAPILDYAGPQPRGRFRLPADSRLDVIHSPGELKVVESLKGQAGAAGAVIFACFTIAVLLADAIALWGKNGHDAAYFCLSVATLQFIVMLAVIENTWRKTILTVTPAHLALRFRSPLRGSTLHNWPAEKLRSVQVIHTQLQKNGPEFAELEIDLWGHPRVQLFIGHKDWELLELEHAIRQLGAHSPPPRYSGEGVGGRG